MSDLCPEHVDSWTKDGYTAVVEVQRNIFGSLVVVVSHELMRQMLTDLGYELNAEVTYLDEGTR